MPKIIAELLKAGLIVGLDPKLMLQEAFETLAREQEEITNHRV